MQSVSLPTDAASAGGEAADVHNSEIVVTALKRAQSVQDVPATVDVVGRAELETSAIYTIEQLRAVAPGVLIQRPPNNTANASIRGLGTAPGPVSFDHAVPMFADGSALACGTPFFLFFGWLSDKIGRKKIILTGCALAALTMFPTFHMLAQAANPALVHAQETAPVKVMANPAECSSQFDPVGGNKFDTTSCDIVKNALAKAAVNYENVCSCRDHRRNPDRREDLHRSRSCQGDGR